MRSLNKSDRLRGKKLRDLGCIVCMNEFELFTPPAIHHILGQTIRHCHQFTIPLCPKHHQYKSNSRAWVSLHGDGESAFKEAYGSELDLLEQVNKLI